MDSNREQFKTNKGRCAQRDVLNAEIQARLNERWNLKELVAEMAVKGIPFSEIKSAAQLLQDPEIEGMGITQKVETKKYSDEKRQYLEYPRNPVRYSRSECAEITDPPLLGE